MQIMRQRNPVIEQMVHSHLVWFEDLNKKTMLVIQLIVSEEAKKPVFLFEAEGDRDCGEGGDS